MSTEFTVGLDGRNSSKVLKPPGGGSSDIFGVSTDDSNKEPVKAEATSKPSSKPTASVAAKKSEVVRRNPITGEGLEVEQDNNLVEKGIVDNSLSEMANEETKIEPSKTIQTSIRIRNPPGGKSSGIF